MRKFAIVVLIAALFLGLQIYKKKRAAENEPTFGEMLKNPQHWQQHEQSEADIEAQISAAAAWSDAKVRDEVRRWVLSGTLSDRGQGRVLHSLGARVDAPVLEILTDPALKGQLSQQDPKNFMFMSPLLAATSLLSAHAPEKLVEPLLPFADHPDKNIRATVVSAFARAATANTAPVLKKAMSDSDRTVRMRVMLDLKLAKKIAPECAAILFDPVQSLVTQGSETAAASVLIRLNEAKALAYFESPEFFHVNSPGLSGALYAVVFEKKTLPREKLLKLIAENHARPKGSDPSGQLFYLIWLLGRHQHPDDRDFFEKMIHDADPARAETAADGYLAYHGLDDLFERTSYAIQARTWSGLTQPQRSYLAVWWLDAEFSNGGIEQYFFNSSGDNWKDALTGLNAMGMTLREKHLQNAVEKFGPEGPSVVRAQRQEQLALVVRKNENVFRDGSIDYEVPEQSLHLAMAKFAVKNKESFK